ncbi:hypothetical protein EG329_011640 [Mollisiaceae sp. DMI_Dod_QoI]|nr:hypothetical protein EG329_011640 [Helotiales sp. DMI_Dod_QoI]
MAHGRRSIASANKVEKEVTTEAAPVMTTGRDLSSMKKYAAGDGNTSNFDDFDVADVSDDSDFDVSVKPRKKKTAPRSGKAQKRAMTDTQEEKQDEPAAQILDDKINESAPTSEARVDELLDTLVDKSAPTSKTAWVPEQSIKALFDMVKYHSLASQIEKFTRSAMSNKHAESSEDVDAFLGDDTAAWAGHCSMVDDLWGKYVPEFVRITGCKPEELVKPSRPSTE